MKKWLVLIVIIGLFVVGALFLPSEKQEYDYLRLHIRANSNSQLDQEIKYEIKTMVVDVLTPSLCNIESKENAIKVIEECESMLEAKCDQMLKEKGYNYKTNIKISNEYFPTRTYSNTTLESGYYDAVIVELGEAEGDNWWCVMYPPLCFVNKIENEIQIKYKSKIVEIFEQIFG